MSQAETLRSLESVLVSFLERAVHLKEERLGVLNGINRLDDIARSVQNGEDFADKMGGWFAEHNRWLAESAIRPAERKRIHEILAEIKREIGERAILSPAGQKVQSEIERWGATDGAPVTGEQIKLSRGAESAPESEQDSISLFTKALTDINNLFADVSANKAHLMSILDDSLNSATLQLRKDALLLSALIIYYLKQNGYKVDPFVRRLKEAEKLCQKGGY